MTWGHLLRCEDDDVAKMKSYLVMNMMSRELTISQSYGNFTVYLGRVIIINY